jgi:hypothetical protein
MGTSSGKLFAFLEGARFVENPGIYLEQQEMYPQKIEVACYQ